MSGPGRGLYEVLITEALAAQLSALGDELVAHADELRPADAADRIALHLSRVIQRAVASVKDKDRVKVGVALARDLLSRLAGTLDKDIARDLPVESAAVLHAIVGRLPDGSAETVEPPLIPLLDTTLLTNAPGEPRVGHQLVMEIPSADRVDVVMAFIRRSGIGPMVGVERACVGRAQP